MHLASSCWACISGGEQSWSKLHSLHGKPAAEHEPTWEKVGCLSSLPRGRGTAGGGGLTAMVMLPSVLLLYLKLLSWSCLTPAKSSYWPSIPSHSLYPRQEFSPCFHSWRFVICFLYVVCLFLPSFGLTECFFLGFQSISYVSLLAITLCCVILLVVSHFIVCVFNLPQFSIK